MIKSLSTIFFCSFLIFGNAQEIKVNDFKVGLALGISQSGNDTHSWGNDGQGLLSKTNTVVGLTLEYNFDPKFSVRANWFNSKIEGDDSDVEGHEWRDFSFESPLNEFSAELKWKFWKRKTNSDQTDFELSQESPTKRMYLYLSIGAAMTLTDPVVNYGTPTIPAEQLKDENNLSKSHFQIPASLGFNIYLSDNLSLDVEGRGIFATSDLLDGMSAVVNEENNDAYIFGLCRINYDF